ncbi:MAG: hypothetical protein ACRDYD_01305 [Acidimicrobiales bacterium]
MSEVQIDQEADGPRGLTRRQMIQRTAAAGATLAWAVPAVEALTTRAASASPISPHNSAFDFEFAFTLVDPDQFNSEGYYWPFLAVVDTTGALYLLAGPVPSGNQVEVGGMVGGNSYAASLAVPPKDGGLPVVAYDGSSNYFHSTGDNSPGLVGIYNSIANSGTSSTAKISPPVGYGGGEKDYPATVLVSLSGGTLTIELYPDEVANDVEEQGTANFPDIYIYGATAINGTNSHEANLTSSVAISNNSSGSYLEYSSSAVGYNITFSTGPAPGGSGVAITYSVPVVS